MDHILNLPLEVLDLIIALLPPGDLLAVLKTCQTLKPVAERYLYGEFNFKGITEWTLGMPPQTLHEARPLRCLFRSITCRPELGSHLRRFSYAGTSRKGYRRDLLPEDSIGYTGPHPERAFFNSTELKIFNGLLEKLSSVLPSDDRFGQRQGFSFTNLVVQQGFVLAMIDILVLLSPNLRHLSIKINLEQRPHPPLGLYCFGNASLASPNDATTWLSRLQNLSSFVCEGINCPASVARGRTDADVIENVLKLPAIRKITIRNPGKLNAGASGKPSWTSCLRALVINWSQFRPEDLKSWLQASGQLSYLVYGMYLNSYDSRAAWIDCRQLQDALEPIQRTLQSLELYYTVSASYGIEPAYTPAPGVVPSFGVKSHLRSLATFRKLEHLMISLTILLGQSYKTFKDVANGMGSLLPPTLKSFILVDDSRFLYDSVWQELSVSKLCLSFIHDFQNFTPALVFFRLHSRAKGSTFRKRQTQWQATIDDAKNHNLIVELASYADAWRRDPGT